jgi:hypothetical protein
MEEKRNTCRFSVGKPEGKNHFERLGLDGRIILKWILKNRMGGRRLDSTCSKQGQVAGCYGQNS